MGGRFAGAGVVVVPARPVGRPPVAEGGFQRVFPEGFLLGLPVVFFDVMVGSEPLGEVGDVADSVELDERAGGGVRFVELPPYCFEDCHGVPFS